MRSIQSILWPLAFRVAGACADASVPSTLIHEVVAPAAVQAGDTIQVGVHLTDSASASGTLATIRPLCATNIELRRGSTLVATAPSPVTCPDSTYQKTIGHAFSANWDSRFLPLAIPSGAPAGQYTIRSTVLVAPGVTGSTTLTVQ